jgi:hypothetical protein
MSVKENLNTSQSIVEVIKKRKSIRSYKKSSLKAEDMKKLQEYIQQVKGPFDSKVRFYIVDSQAAVKEDNVKLGTYGIIKGATNFIVAVANKDGMSLEELGYKLEAIILYATSLGLGTCWLGGTFKKGEFAKTINLDEDEILPIISPLGYVNESGHILGSIIRSVAGSKHRKAWLELFFNESFDVPLSEEEANSYKLPLEMVRLAPSASNKQPWRIIKKNNCFHFYLKHAKEYSKALGFDIQRIDIGIAMCHFDLTAKELGIFGDWMLLDPKINVPDESYQYIVSWISK